MSLSDDYGYKIRGLDDRADDLQNELESLRTRFGYIDDLESELHSIRREVSSADDKADEVRSSLEELDDDVRSHIADTERALKKLTARIQLMEANLAAADKMPQADFDAFPPSWRTLADLAGRAREARQALLSDRERTTQDSRIRAHTEAVKERDGQYAQVLAAANILATTSYSSRAHQQAGRDFATARSQADHYTRQVNNLAAPARNAQVALTKDSETRARDAELLAEGAQARKKLHWQLRTRISEAIRDRALLPMWFVTVLGPVAPARDTEEWLEAATAVLAYRVTYEITDQVLALGEEPEGYEPARQRWRREISEDLRRW